MPCSARFLLLAPVLFLSALAAGPRPNIVLVMADDMGWGDTKYNSLTVRLPDGSPHPDQGWMETPTLDTMASSGLRFSRFYAASAVCSPTRGSCLTGRNPLRLGIPDANSGRLEFDETPLSEVLAGAGYRTGHFGKWHLGSLTTLRSDSNRGGNASVYSGPWHHGYDTCFVTESKVPTYHPYRIPSNGANLPTSFADPNFYGTYYWRMPDTWNESFGEGAIVPVEEVNNPDNGDDSKLLVDQAIPFVQDAVANDEAFFVVLWFHTPHKPVMDPEGIDGRNSSDALKASIEDMDTALGRFRAELEALGVRDNTMLWFTSDNGPENGVDSPNEVSTTRSIRSGRYLERKRSLHEGGLRVPGILEWPGVIGESGAVSGFPASTSDYYSTILDYLEITVPDQKPLDGVSLRAAIENGATLRTKPIGTQYSGDKSWVNQQYKLINDNGTWELYDLLNVPAGEEPEETALATAADIAFQPQALQNVYHTMLAEYSAWETAVDDDLPYVHSSQPTASLSTDSGTVSAPFTVTATFSEPVTQLHASEFSVANGSPTNLAGSGTSWIVDITPAEGGQVTVSLPAGAVIDADGNINAASNDLEVLYVAPGPPDVTLSGPSFVRDAYAMTITFDEPVTDLTDGDFIVINGTAQGTSGSDAAYTVTITPVTEGTVSVTLPAGAVVDLNEGLGNRLSNTLVTRFTAGSMVTNGDLDAVVNQYGSNSGAAGYSLDTTTLNVMDDGSTDTGVDANEWLWSTLTRGFSYDPNGGDGGTGDGAFVQNGSSRFNQRFRSVILFADDQKETTGEREVRVDLFLDDNTASNALTFHCELFAWNSTQAGPSLSLGGDQSGYNLTAPGDAVTLLDTTVAATEVSDATWETQLLGTFDVGSGYDFYAWRIGVSGQADGDFFAFDNLRATSLSFANWIDRPEFALDPAEQGFGDDPDDDSLPNGLEAWFGSRPNAFSRSLMPVSVNNRTTFICTHPFNANRPIGMTGTYEWSPDLVSWYAGDGADGPDSGLKVTLIPNTAGDTTTVTATASEQVDRYFLRLEVTEE